MSGRSRPPRVLLMRSRSGIACVIADQPVEVLEVDLGASEDRVYRLTDGGALIISNAQVEEMLRGEVISHHADGRDDLAMKPAARLLAN